MKTYLFITILFLWSQSFAINVLQIGDSHTVQGFGEGLYQALSKNSKVTQVRSIGLAGSGGEQWSSDSAALRVTTVGYIERPKMAKPSVNGKVEKLSTLINAQKPDVLIVELADNFASYAALTPAKIQKYTVANKVNSEQARAAIRKATNERVDKHVQMILDQIKNTAKSPQECFWVGPTFTDDENKPDYYKTNARAREVADVIKNKIQGQCQFIDSLLVVKQSDVKTVDRLHLEKSLGIKWGQSVYKDIMQKSKLLTTQ